VSAVVGLLHPGEMGAAVGAALRAGGQDVVWASEDRSAATRARAAAFRDAGTVASLVGEADVILSICPPHAALEVAQACAGFAGIYVDANAISPARARQVAALHPRFVDGGIVGGPPAEPGTTLYLSGEDAGAIAALFGGTVLATRVVTDASAVKMTYAAWSKGTAAMLLAIRDVARHFGVEDEWRLAAPELAEPLERAGAAAAKKGWRWTGEMEEIADTFAAAGQPDGFHRAAAEVFRG
jgi:3-hydroxyisobutyrate dehydrogenase-like beta-hydroxyacid dehydrogenase